MKAKVLLLLLLGGATAYVVLFRNKAEPSAAEAPSSPTSEPEPEPIVTVQAEPSTPTPPAEPERTLGPGSTRQEVLDVLGTPTGEMTISGIETLYYDGVEIRFKHGIVISIPDDISRARQASREAEAERNALAEQRAKEREAQREAARTAAAPSRSQGSSQPNQTIRKGGQEVHLSSMVGKGSVTIVDFFADWCGPCRKIDPYLKQMAQDPNVNLIKIDIVDWNTPVVRQHRIQSVPNVRVFDAKGRQVGGITSNPNQVQKWVNQAKGSS